MASKKLLWLITATMLLTSTTFANTEAILDDGKCVTVFGIETEVVGASQAPIGFGKDKSAKIIITESGFILKKDSEEVEYDLINKRVLASKPGENSITGSYYNRQRSSVLEMLHSRQVAYLTSALSRMQDNQGKTVIQCALDRVNNLTPPQ